VSTGHRTKARSRASSTRYGEEKPQGDLFQMLGEGDTPALYARNVNLDTDHDVPYAGGNSVDGRTVYIDRALYRELMDYRTQLRGMTARQIAQAIAEHEHTEWAIDAGDNPVDAYLAAHGFAIAAEHKFVRMLRIDPERYERALAPALARCLARDPKNPPRDLWCGPYLDDPTPRDRALLRIFRAKGVVDALKASKVAANYGIGARACGDCRHYSGGECGTCEKVCGIVRANRQCDRWEAQKPA
jgi:hypothetical protein